MLGWSKLPCAGKLGRCRVHDRFHSGCLVCRWRRKYQGKWCAPPFWIDYTMLWNYTEKEWWTVNIDPRGHFTALRCTAIMVCDRVLKVFHRLEKPLIEVCMFLSCYPTF